VLRSQAALADLLCQSAGYSIETRTPVLEPNATHPFLSAVSYIIAYGSNDVDVSTIDYGGD
jgi:hypothetical protein